MSKSSPCRRQPSFAIRACSCDSGDPSLSEPKSAANRLPGALSDMTLSSNRTSASRRQKADEHALGEPRSGLRRRRSRRPAARPANPRAGRCPPCDARRWAPRRAATSVAVLNSITSGWSISYTVVPAGQESRYGRAIQPRRHDDDLAHARAGGLGEVLVVVPGAGGEDVDHPRKTRRPSRRRRHPARRQPAG